MKYDLLQLPKLAGILRLVSTSVADIVPNGPYGVSTLVTPDLVSQFNFGQASATTHLVRSNSTGKPPLRAR